MSNTIPQNDSTRLRKIIHIDMDAFFASVEQRDNPALRGRPIAVGHADRRGVVATASYEARRFGVRSAMPSARAMRLCPQLIMVEPRFAVYKEVSAAMHEIFHEYTDRIEPISLDEAFLDVTENKPGIAMAVEIARQIKEKIRSRLSLTASAGISYCKFLAKVASDMRKPDGICTIHPDIARRVIDALPVECFWGVGPVTAEKMHRLAIHTGADLYRLPRALLVREFGKAGNTFYDFARGIDNRPVEARSERKSVSCEQTYGDDLTTDAQIDAALKELAEDLSRRLKKSGFQGVTATLKVRFSDFTDHSRSQTFDHIPEDDPVSLHRLATELLQTFGDNLPPIRLLGLGLSNPASAASISEFRTSSSAAPTWRQLEIDFSRQY